MTLIEAKVNFQKLGLCRKNSWKLLKRIGCLNIESQSRLNAKRKNTIVKNTEHEGI